MPRQLTGKFKSIDRRQANIEISMVFKKSRSMSDFWVQCES
jgi:hypothetical protein